MKKNFYTITLLLFLSALSAGNIDVLINSDKDIAGFQFNVANVTITGASGGLAASSGFSVTASATTVIGFSLSNAVIPAGSNGVLTIITTSEDDVSTACIESVTLSDTDGGSVSFQIQNCLTLLVKKGCTNSAACNYDSEATYDDSSDASCTFPPTNFDCAGNCLVEVDCAGVCGGSANSTGECTGCMDDGLQVWSKYLGVPACNFNASVLIHDQSICTYPDCSGICGGSLAGTGVFECSNNSYTTQTACETHDFIWEQLGNDECGVCGGSNYSSQCLATDACTEMDCNGECGGFAYMDVLQNCVHGSTGIADALLLTISSDTIQYTGADIRIPIYAENLPPLEALDFIIEYDPTVIEVIGATLADSDLDENLYQIPYNSKFIDDDNYDLINSNLVRSNMTIYANTESLVAPPANTQIEVGALRINSVAGIEFTQTSQINIYDLLVNGIQMEIENRVAGDITVHVNRGCKDDGFCSVEDCGYDSPYPEISACNFDASKVIHIDDGSCEYVMYCNDICGGGYLHDQGVMECTDPSTQLSYDLNEPNCLAQGNIWSPRGNDVCGYCEGSSVDAENCACEDPADPPDCRGECPTTNVEGTTDWIPNPEYTGEANDECGVCGGENSTENCEGGNWNVSQCTRMDCAGNCYGTAYFDACGNCIGGETGLPDCLSAEFILYSPEGELWTGDPVQVKDTFFTVLHLSNLPLTTASGVNFILEYDETKLELLGWSLQPEYLSESLTGDPIFDENSYFLEPGIVGGFMYAGVYTSANSNYPDSGDLIYLKFSAADDYGESTTLAVNTLQVEEYSMSEANFTDRTLIITENLSIENTQSGLMPDAYLLYQNFPNPFNPVTTITYQIPQYDRVNIAIYNIKGQEIKSLLNWFQNPGTYSVIWNGTDNAGNPVPAGIYIYYLNTQFFQSNRKLVLLK